MLDAIRNHSILGRDWDHGEHSDHEEDADHEEEADIEGDADPAEECPRILIDAIQRRLCAVQIGAAAAFGRPREEAGLAEELEKSATSTQSGIKPDETHAQHTSRETDLQLQILEDENKMLRDCLIGWVNRSSQAAGERDEGPPTHGSVAFGVEVLINKLTASERQRSILEHRVKELEKIQNQHGHIFEMLLSTDPVPDGTPDCKPVIRYIKRELEEHRKLGEVIGPALTVRGVLTLKTIQHQHTQLQNKSQAGGDLDTVLSLQDAIDLASQLDNNPHLMDHESTRIQTCSRCKTPRFLRLPPISSSTPPSSQQHPSLPPQTLHSPIPLTIPRSEFNASSRLGQKQTPGCCRQLICDACVYPAVVSRMIHSAGNLSSLGSDRDRDRDRDADRDDGDHGDSWLSCPAPNCTSPSSTTLPVHHSTTTDGSVGGEDAEWEEIVREYAEN